MRNKNGKIVGLERRAEPKAAIAPQSVGPCPVCGQLLMAVPWQQVRFHKECRKKGRKMFGRATQVREVTPTRHEQT